MGNLTILLLVVAAFGIFFTTLFVLTWFRHHVRLKSQHPSFNDHLHRIPRISLLRQLDALNEDFSVYLVSAVALPLVIYATLISCSYFMAVMPTAPVLWLTSLSTAGVTAYLILTLVKLLKRRRTLRLDFEGELAVGHELNRLMGDGYRVFHDFPADNYNIDHVVAGPKGVFAVETRTDSKSATPKKNADPTINYDGRMLTFPDKSDYETIELAQQQAEWLSEWLGATTGEPIAVRAIVATPGWVVKRTSAEGIPVVNPSQFATLFEHIKPRPVSETMLNRIMEKLEQKSASSKTPLSRDGQVPKPQAL